MPKLSFASSERNVLYKSFRARRDLKTLKNYNFVRFILAREIFVGSLHKIILKFSGNRFGKIFFFLGRQVLCFQIEKNAPFPKILHARRCPTLDKNLKHKVAKVTFHFLQKRWCSGLNWNLNISPPKIGECASPKRLSRYI